MDVVNGNKVYRFWIKIEKVPDQSGLKNVIQHTYYLKEDINNDRFTEKNDIQL